MFYSYAFSEFTDGCLKGVQGTSVLNQKALESFNRIIKPQNHRMGWDGSVQRQGSVSGFLGLG